MSANKIGIRNHFTVTCTQKVLAHLIQHVHSVPDNFQSQEVNEKF